MAVIYIIVSCGLYDCRQLG